MAKTRAQQQQQDAIRIEEDRDKNRPVIFRPADDDLFVRNGRQVIEACRLGISIEVWVEELAAMLQRVREWVGQQAGKVQACYCAPKGGKSVLFFIPAAEQYDFDLADKLAELNVELVKGFNVGMVDIHQIPAGELDRFVEPKSARLVYGEHREPHPPVEA